MSTGLNRICTHNQKRLTAHHFYLSQRQYQISPRGPRPLLLSRALHSSTHRHFLCLQGCHYYGNPEICKFPFTIRCRSLTQLLFLSVNWIICMRICYCYSLLREKKFSSTLKLSFCLNPPFAISLSSLPLFHITLIFCSLISGSRQLDAITQQLVSQARINLFIVRIGYRKKLD